MQSIFRLPWCSEHISSPKLSEKDAIEKMRATAVVEIPALNKFKRKRSISTGIPSPSQSQLHKKPCADGAALAENTRTLTKEQTQTQTLESTLNDKAAMQPLNASPVLTSGAGHISMSANDEPASGHVSASEDVDMVDSQPSTSAGSSDLTPLQQVIENEFNMQILMKHNELRLIESELAKCQVALEQLRRCELRPYPGNDRPSEAVSSGIGPSIAPPMGYTRPSHPSPYGVTDGPYSRHYGQWLLSDPQFDAGPIHSPLSPEAMAQAAGRSTRNSGSVRKSISKSFVFPGRPLENLQSIPNYPPVPVKDKSSPLILRRSTDGQLVKLICNNCLRGNFSSIQGFLNHCRIAHKVDYKSHDLAAIDCGRTLDENEAANLPLETQNTPIAKPTVSRASTMTSTPHRNLVHPFNTTGGASMAVNSKVNTKAVPRAPIQDLNSAAKSEAKSPFTPSTQAPHLSSYFAKHQLGGDLAKATARAKERIDLGMEEYVSSPDVSEQNSPLEPLPGMRTLTGAKQGPVGRKGVRPVQERPRPSPLAPTPSVGAMHVGHSDVLESPEFFGPNLSPHTADSNPGLVSDHEDDDHGSASEEEAPPADTRRPFVVGRNNCSDNVEIEMADDEDIDQSGVIIRRNSIIADKSPSRKMGVVKRSG